MIPVQLEYTAPSGCPTQAEFVTFVANRGGDFARPDPRATARKMIVTLRREGTEHSGSLELRGVGQASDARQLHAARCVEVAEALAVVAAIALRGADNTATPETGQVDSPAEQALQRAPKAEVHSAPPGNPARAEPTNRDERRLRTAGFWGDEDLQVPAGPLQVKRSVAATLSGGAVLGVVPGLVLPRFDLTLSRANYIVTPAHSSLLIGNVFGVRWSYLGKGTLRSGGYTTDLSGFKAGVHGCASLHYDLDGFVALLCSSFTVGLMQVDTHGASADYVQHKSIGLGAASVDFDARYNLGKYLHVGLMAGGEAWVGKLTAERADGSELFHSRLFNVNLQLGLGVHF